MTFFYDLNKKLKDVLDAPKSEHKQLNEGTVTELSDKKLAAYQDKAQKQLDRGENVAKRTAGVLRTSHSARRNKGLDPYADTANLKNYPLGEEGMSRAAKGYEKYGKEGMEALAKAGREGKALEPIRKKYDKYDESIEEGSTGDYSAKKARAGKDIGKPGKNFEKIAKSAGEKYGSKERGEKVAGAVLAKLRGKNESVEEGLGDVVKKVGGAVKKAAGKALDTLGHGSDEDLIRDMQKKAGVPQTGKKPMAQPKEGAAPMTAKQKSFAALAEPKDKITFADKIAGAKKEVDEMLGDVAAEAMKQAIGGGKKVVADEASQDNAFTAHKRPRIEKPPVGTITRGSKHDVEEIPGGRRVTRRVDPQGISVGADDDKPADGEKRGRGRPKGTGGKMGAKGPSGSSKLMTKEGDVSTGNLQKMHQLVTGLKMFVQDEEGLALLKELTGLVKHYMSQGSEKPLDEKAVSKKQQKFMGMVHAAQKGEKPASKEVAKVAKSMGKKDAEDFAATKHKGLPEKKKPEGKKKEKTEEAGGSGTPTASSGFSYGKGIYDSMNRDLEDMIAESMARLDSTLNESMSVNMSNSTEGGKSLSITATEEDALKLAAILKMAGLGDGGAMHSDHGVVPASDCGCGGTPCNCNEELDEVDENQPDYPTETETSDDAMQYSGGLNGPKSTGQTTVPVIASQEERQGTYAEAEEAAIKRMMEMAGISEAKKDVEEDDVEEGNLFTGNLAKARAAGKKEADLDGDGDMEKVRESVDESILAATRNLWKTYQPK